MTHGAGSQRTYPGRLHMDDCRGTSRTQIRVFVLTGAGLPAESGRATFRVRAARGSDTIYGMSRHRRGFGAILRRCTESITNAEPRSDVDKDVHASRARSDRRPCRGGRSCHRPIGRGAGLLRRQYFEIDCRVPVRTGADLLVGERRGHRGATKLLTAINGNRVTRARSSVAAPARTRGLA